MEQNLNNKKVELKDKLFSFYDSNKLKIYVFLGILLIIVISAISFNLISKKKNMLISEKYVQANLYLAINETQKSKIIYEEIISSKNNFYSILALNAILEKNLETDSSKILGYFEIIEKLNKSSNEQTDLIILKKALYLIKNASPQEGKQLLKNLIEKDSKFKFLAEEIITN